MHDFWKEYASEIVKIAPRTEALETPIKKKEKKTITTEYGYTYKDVEIKVDETRKIN